ncbi:hypothetical protein [Longimicrobium sp.]|jgi:hypothetical protein|uniref:M1 family metallopeptidase n=1 Tax=Longimicrobium sp. TaxID=2029185 RepID=UPI002ED9E008
MKLWEVFRFEIGHQARRYSTWAYAAALLALALQMATEVYIAGARDGLYLYNAPFVIASVTLMGSMLGLVSAAALAGDAAARDVQLRMHPLFYSAPVGKGAYQGGRFLAAFALNALLLLAIPLAVLLAAPLWGLEAEFRGPFRIGGYVGAYLAIALPNAFVATALGFALAALTRRAVASYLGSVLLFFAMMFSWQFLAAQMGRWQLAKYLDPIGITVLSEAGKSWTAAEKNTLYIGLQPSLITNRLLWMGIAMAALAITYLRFRFAHPPVGGRSRRAMRAAEAVGATPSAPVVVPIVPRAFGVRTRLHQVLAVAAESFRLIVTSWGGAALAFLTIVLVLTGPEWMEHMGVPLVPTTDLVVGPLGDFGEPIWMIIPVMIVFYAGELVWREREAGLGEMADAVPVPDWVSFVGKFAGLALVLAALQVLMMAGAMLVQASLGYRDFQLDLYVRILFGLQLADYLLFALLAFVIHVVVNQKYAGHLALVMAYAVMAFGPSMGMDNHLLVYGSDPGWSYSDMRGFGALLGPVVVYKLYWAAWALMFGVAARLLWVRGREAGWVSRMRVARRRFTHPVARVAAVAMALILGLGGFAAYNTYLLNDHESDSAATAARAEYERRYGRYEGVAQPRLTATHLHVEIHPGRREVEIRGSYRLVNAGAVPIRSVHVATASEVETGTIGFDRPATRRLADEQLGHRIYALAQPLQSGDSLEMRFSIRHAPRGFSDDDAVAVNGTYFIGRDWLPAIGYQPGRELANAADRRAHGLAPRPVRAPGDVAARMELPEPRIGFEAIVGTAAGQTAFAPGTLRRTWMKDGRRYFHYSTDAPIRNDFAIFSAQYAVRRGRAGGVDVEVVHHPGHAWNVDGMVRGLAASLEYHTKHFGPYPHAQLRLVEHPGDGLSLHAYPINISYQEKFALMDPRHDAREVDFPFAIVAHEVAHQWWGNQVMPARVDGAPLLSESLAWYSALGVVEATYGPEHLRRLLGLMREAYLTPHSRAAAPLLRADDWLLYSRKGPFAMYALREYVGEQRVNGALRRFLQVHGSGVPPLPTSLDLYRELQAATPDSLRPLLADLFERNTYWELATEQASAQLLPDGTWRVTLDVQARKVVVDSAGGERELPMDDLVEIGVYAASADAKPGEPLYRRMHRVRSGEHRITVIVPRRPARAGIDPRILLIDDEPGDNLADVAVRTPR